MLAKFFFEIDRYTPRFATVFLLSRLVITAVTWKQDNIGCIYFGLRKAHKVIVVHKFSEIRVLGAPFQATHI